MTRFILSFFTILFVAVPAFAQVEPGFQPDEPLATTPWFEWMNAEEKMADMHFITHMRPHHAGALTMSQAYLKDDAAQSPRLKKLARAIVHNQTFEIGVLNTLEDILSRSSIAEGETKRIHSAQQGLAQNQRFIYAPIPTFVNNQGSASARDVQFAKAMIVHHEGAVDMCKAYNNNPNSVNGYIRKLCLDITTGQTIEIELMHDIIEDYDGNPDAISIKPGMVDGMDHMLRGKDVNAIYRTSFEAHG